MAHIVSYSHVTTANIPQDGWDEAWFALASWKGYLQSFPGLLTVEISARALDNGDILLHTITRWETPEQLEEWRESQWSVNNLVTSTSQPAYEVNETTYEDFC